MGEMAAALAHQIRTPLSAALLYLSNATGSELPPAAQDKMLSKATKCLRDLEQLITDMLHFARGAGSGEDDVDIDELLQSVGAAVTPLLRKDQQLDICGLEQKVMIKGNQEALAGALINLISNALAHAGNQAKVSLQVTTAGLEIRFTVTDNGPGVPAQHAEQIFDPFYTTRPDGTGLGLAVVRSVARAHGGDIQLSRNTASGAVFTLRLPAHPISATSPKKDAAA